MLVDLLPPGPHDPQGMHAAILERQNPSASPYDLPAEEPLTLAGYVAGPHPEAFLEHLAVGSALPDMPLFLDPERYVNVALERACQAAWHEMPQF